MGWCWLVIFHFSHFSWLLALESASTHVFLPSHSPPPLSLNARVRGHLAHCQKESTCPRRQAPFSSSQTQNSYLRARAISAWHQEREGTVHSWWPKGYFFHVLWEASCHLMIEGRRIGLDQAQDAHRAECVGPCLLSLSSQRAISLMKH